MDKKVFVFLLLVFPNLALANRQLNIVATTTSLADIAAQVAKDKAKIDAIASPRQDIHHYAPTPKDVLKVKKANVLIHEGLDLEVWRQPLLDAAGNTKFLGAHPSNVLDASRGISLLEVPSSLSRAEGDIHAFGNPHYMGSPENAKIVASNIAEGLSKAAPADADFFRKNAEEFNQKLDEKIKDWKARLAPWKGSPVVTYHRSWIYFTESFGFTIAGEVEPKPGIPPTAKHLAALIQIMKDKKVKVIIREIFEERNTPQKIANASGASVVTLSQAVPRSQDYVSMMEQNIQTLEEAFKKGAAS